MRIVAGVVSVFAAAAVGTAACGQTFTATGLGKDPGETLSASATFTISNLDLVVALSNTGTFDPANADDILTGIFFTLSGDPTLTPESAQVAPGSLVVGHRLPLGFTGDVGSQWAYRNDLVRAPDGADEGISSTKLKWFGTKNLFSKTKIKGFGSFNGISFGLTTADDNPDDNQGLIQNSVVLTFSGLPQDFTLSDISDVVFQYGTSLKQPELLCGAGGSDIAEPPTMALVAMGILGALTASRGRRTLVY
jgi:predicted small secreted protein